MNTPTRETATILAALRLWQHFTAKDCWRSPYPIPDGIREDIERISSDDGTLKPLTAEEIDSVCEAVNFSDDSATVGRLVLALQSAHSALGDAQTQFEQCEKMFEDDAEFIAAGKAVDKAIDVCWNALEIETVKPEGEWAPQQSALDNAHSALNAAGQFLARIRPEFAGDSEYVEAAALVDEASTVAAAALDVKPETQGKLVEKYRDGARQLIAGDDTLSIDEGAAISKTDDGAHVQCWVFVSDQEAGIE